METPAFKIRSSQAKLLSIITFVGISISIASYIILAPSSSNSAWEYPFQRQKIGNITQKIQEEIVFYQQRIQQQPTAGLDRSALAQAYLKMARATGESSWYLLAQQTAEQSLIQLPVHNYGATIVLAKVATAKHEFTQALSLLKQLPPEAESLALLTTTHLALGDVKTARQTANTLVERIPTLSNLALKALVELAQGKDLEAIRDFKAAIAAEEPEELYQSALRILPKYPPALLNLAELSVRQWQADPTQTRYQNRAIELYDRFFLTTQKSPTIYDHVALRGLARVQKLTGDTTQSTQTWERAVARLRNDFGGFGHRRELAQLLLERGQGNDKTEALTLMQAEIKIRQDPETWDTLAAAYLQLGQLERAQQAIDTALKSGIKDPAITDRAALIAQSRGQSAQAQKYREQVKSIDPLFDAGARQALGLGVGLSGLN
jgi:tetratricopeptide (TPR) repeat protein